MTDNFVTKDGKKLRCGYTTGACACAAAKAAAWILLSGQRCETVHLLTPKGVALTLVVENTVIRENAVVCGIRKDSGDDPDVTNGITVYARVEKMADPGIRIDGGEGVGRVTKPGLDQPVGSAAINSTPRRMITGELLTVCEESGYTGGLRVTISAPGGAEIAQKTFNPRLGIVGGISILGTTGIVEPMSDSAVIATIRTELSMRRAGGQRVVLLVPGNYGADYIKNALGFDPERAVTTSNFIGEAFSAAEDMGFEGALLIGHIGKLVKLAGGMFNTHSRWGDCRAEIFAAHAGMCGASRQTVEKLMESVMTDDMLDITEQAGIRTQVMDSIMAGIARQLAHRPLHIRRGAMAFSKRYGLLGMTPEAPELMKLLKEDAQWCIS